MDYHGFTRKNEGIIIYPDAEKGHKTKEMDFSLEKGKWGDLMPT